ncbi:MAG: ketoacyl-ACP synthase III [Bacteroidales bacterium]|nr:ketoacyl-ACP synthase III [Bacteroidales bacterium]
MHTIIDNVQIKAVNAWLPEEVLEMTQLSSQYGEAEVASIMKTTGVERVRIAPKDMTSSDMCLKSAEQLFEQEGIDKAEIDGLVFVSQTTDWLLPATSISLQHRLGLSQELACMDVHYGCSGYIYGLFQAATWVATGACKNVLVLAGDTTSQMINPNDKSLKMVFGDCGTATIVSDGNTRMGFRINSDGSGADRLIVPAGGFRLPISEETSVLEWDEDKNGRTKNDLFMDGMAIFNFAITKVKKQVKALMEDMAWTKEDVGFYGLHQANEFMVNYVRKSLKADEALTPINVRNYGNTGPATLPLLLSDVCSGEHTYDLSKTIMCGFGVGLSWGSVAADLSNTHFYSPVNK